MSQDVSYRCDGAGCKHEANPMPKGVTSAEEYLSGPHGWFAVDDKEAPVMRVWRITPKHPGKGSLQFCTWEHCKTWLSAKLFTTIGPMD